MSLEDSVRKALSEQKWSNSRKKRKKSNAKVIAELNLNRPIFASEPVVQYIQDNFKAIINEPDAEIHQEQLMAAMAAYYSEKGVALDVKTGEGKTLISGLTAKLLNESGKKVDIYTTNFELALRDYLFYKDLGLDIGVVIDPDKAVDRLKDNEAQIKNTIKKNVDYHLIRDLRPKYNDIMTIVSLKEISEDMMLSVVDFIDKESKLPTNQLKEELKQKFNYFRKKIEKMSGKNTELNNHINELKVLLQNSDPQLQDLLDLDKANNRNNLNTIDNELESYIVGSTYHVAKMIEKDVAEALGSTLYDSLDMNWNFNIRYWIGESINERGKIIREYIADSLEDLLQTGILNSNKRAYLKPTMVSTLSQAVFDYERQLLGDDENMRFGRDFDTAIVDEFDSSAFSTDNHVINDYTEHVKEESIYDQDRNKKEFLTTILTRLTNTNKLDELKADEYVVGPNNFLTKNLVTRLLYRISQKDEQHAINRKGVRAYVKEIITDDTINDALKNYDPWINTILDIEKVKRKVNQFSDIIYEIVKSKNKNPNREANFSYRQKLKLAKFIKMENKDDTFVLPNKRAIKKIEDISEIITTINKAIHLEKDRDYFIKGDKVELLDKNTKEPKENSQYSDLLQETLELIHFGEIKSESKDNRAMIKCSCTAPEYLKQFQKLIGLSGSNGIVDHITKEIYDLNTVEIPVHQYSPTYVKPGIDDVFSNTDSRFSFEIVEDRDNKYEKTVNAIQEDDNPKLVVGHVDELKELNVYLQANGINANMLSHENYKDYAKVIGEAGNIGKTTLATGVAGRGADISAESKDKPLDVIIISLNHLNELEQITGRANRQGVENGKVKLIVSKDDEYLGSFKGYKGLGKRTLDYTLYSKLEQLKQGLKHSDEFSVFDKVRSTNSESEIQSISENHTKELPNVDRTYDEQKSPFRRFYDASISNLYKWAPFVNGGVAYASSQDLEKALMTAGLTLGIYGTNEIIRRTMNQGNDKAENTGFKKRKHYPNRFAHAMNKLGENFVYAASAAGALLTGNVGWILPYYGAHDLMQREDSGSLPFKENKVKKIYNKKI